MLDAPVFWGADPVGIGSVNEGEEDSLLCRTGALRLFSMHRAASAVSDNPLHDDAQFWQQIYP